MKPKKSPSQKKAVATDGQILQDYTQQLEALAQVHGQQDSNLKKSYEAGERMLREAELLRSGQKISGNELPPWVRKIYRKLPFLQPGPLPIKPYVEGHQAGQALALALSIRDNSPKDSTFMREAGLLMFYLAEGAMAHALHYPQKEAHEFFEGLAQGQRHSFDSSGQMLLTDASLLYLTLLIHWREIVKMKSVTELHSYLDKLGFFPPQSLDLERFQKLCYRLGLKLTKRGRPKK